MALDFSLADFLQSRGRQAPAAQTFADIIGFDETAAADNSAASNALLESILLNMRQAPPPKSQNILESLASSFDARQPDVSADYIFRGNPSAPSATATNPLLEAVAQAASRSGLDEPSVSPNSITGDIRRSVNVPQVMADNTAMFQRTMPKNVPQPRVIYPPPVLPPIFEALKSVGPAAAQITGYDPRNPPQLETLTKQQALALNPLQRQQYLDFIHERGQKIKAARDAYENLVDLGQRATVNEHLTKERTKTLDAEVASSNLADAEQKKREADAAESAATQKGIEWQNEVDKSLAKKFITQDPKTGVIKVPLDKVGIAGTEKSVERLNAEALQNQKAVAEATRARVLADQAVKEARDRASRKGRSTASTSTAINSPKRVLTQADFNRLDSGDSYIGKDGRTYRKP